MTRGAEARIDLRALRANQAVARAAAPRSLVYAMVKADAYGHGLVPVAEALADAVDGFGVAHIEEALALRRAGIGAPIVLLEGVLGPEGLQEAARHGLEVVAHQWEQLALLEQCSLERPVWVWLKLDTGMNRLGFKPEEFHEAMSRLRPLAQVRGVVGMTHLACADEPQLEVTPKQIECYYRTAEPYDLAASLANSAGLLQWPDAHGERVRPGIMLYGVSPFADTPGPDWGLEPVMTLSSHLIAVREVRAGECVGYGATWCAEQRRRVGVVAIGYGDGYPRHASSGTPVLVKGHRARLLGRVSMDMISVDLEGVPEPRVGDRVVLWGEGLAPEVIARHAGTIAYELFCQVTARVPRRYLEADRASRDHG